MGNTQAREAPAIPPTFNRAKYEEQKKKRVEWTSVASEKRLVMVTPFLILSVILVVVQWMVFAVLKANDAADDGTANTSSMSLSTLQFTLHTPLGVVATNIATLIFHYRATDAWPVWKKNLPREKEVYAACIAVCAIDNGILYCPRHRPRVKGFPQPVRRGVAGRNDVCVVRTALPHEEHGGVRLRAGEGQLRRLGRWRAGCQGHPPKRVGLRPCCGYPPAPRRQLRGVSARCWCAGRHHRDHGGRLHLCQAGSMRIIGDAFHLLPQAEQDAYDAAKRGEARASQSPPRASGVSSHGPENTQSTPRCSPGPASASTSNLIELSSSGKKGPHMGSTSAGRSEASPVGRLRLRGPPPSPEKTIKEG